MIGRLLFAVLVASSAAAWADSWAPPSKQTYLSADGRARLTVTPRDLKSALSYFDDKVEGREPAGAPPGSKTMKATAVLELRTASGRWEKAWTKPLTNEVAPVDAIIADGGSSFVTFDNWHSTGYGPNAIAIFGRDGNLVRQIGLDDLFPDWFIAALPHSVSSIRWRGRFSADGAELIVPIIQPSNDLTAFDKHEEIELAFRLTDGAPVGLEKPEWKAAFAKASATTAERCAADRQELTDWNAPISAPTTSKEEDWHHYLRETQFRTKWSDDPPYPDTTVLRPSSAPDFQASVKWLEEALTEKAPIEHHLRAIASPDMNRLTVEIERIAQSVRAGQLKDVDLVIVADAAHRERIRTALARSGASLTIIDPATSFPQVPQRIRNEAELTVCKVSTPSVGQAAWWQALPFLSLAGGIFLLRRG